MDQAPRPPEITPAAPEVRNVFVRPAENIPRGIACLLAATSIFSGINMLAKWLSETYPVGEIVFFRSAASLLPSMIIVAMGGGLLSLRTTRLRKHMFRCLFGFISLSAAFASFAMMPLGDAVAIGFAGPLIVTALSVPLLSDKVGVHRWSAVAVGFVGVLLMTNPYGGNAPLLGVAMALANAFFYALSMISVRQLGFTETAASMIFYHSVFQTLFALFLLPLGWVTPGPVDFLLLFGIGIAGGLSQWLIILAFRQAPPSALSPFAYVGLVWALFWGWLVWNEWPTFWLIVGAVLVVSAGLYILHREMLRGVKPAPAATPGSS